MKKILFGLALALASTIALADSAALQWTPSTAATCADGKPLVNCPTTGYNVEQRKELTGTWAPVTTTAPTVTSYTVPNLGPGNWYFRVCTATLNNLCSTFTDGDKPKVIAVSVPNPPGAVTVQ